MTGPATLSLNIDNKQIEALLKTQMETQIAGVLAQHSDRLIEEIVRQTLTIRVDREGKPCSYGNTEPYVVWASRKAIQSAVDEAIREMIEKSKPQIKAALKRHMKAHPDKLVNAMADGVLGAMSRSWSFSVGVKVMRIDED